MLNAENVLCPGFMTLNSLEVTNDCRAIWTRMSYILQVVDAERNQTASKPKPAKGKHFLMLKQNVQLFTETLLEA